MDTQAPAKPLVARDGESAQADGHSISRLQLPAGKQVPIGQYPSLARTTLRGLTFAAQVSRAFPTILSFVLVLGGLLAQFGELKLESTSCAVDMEGQQLSV